MEVIKFCHSAIVFFSFWFLFPATTFAYLGVNYGRVADNLPPSTTAVELVQSINATKVRIYDADRQVLGAFANTNVELIVAVGNEFLTEIASPEDALNWVKSNVQAYLPATKITGIAVGNEVLTLEDRSFSDNLVLAMQSVYNALVKLNLDKQVIVTTPHAVNVLQTSYPPSTGSFRQDLLGNIDKILKFHSKTGSPVFLNVYPFFAYKGNPKEIPLDYALLKPTVGIVDPNTNLHYENMLYAQIDAFHSAIASLGYKELAVHVSETGWPSKGDTDEAAATPQRGILDYLSLMEHQRIMQHQQVLVPDCTPAPVPSPLTASKLPSSLC